MDFALLTTIAATPKLFQKYQVVILDGVEMIVHFRLCFRQAAVDFPGRRLARDMVSAAQMGRVTKI